jgi:Polyketide synthase dehydratase
VRDVHLLKALVIPEQERVELQLAFVPHGHGEHQFIGTSYSESVWTEHCTGTVVVEQVKPGVYGMLSPSDVLPDVHGQTVPPAELYAQMDAAGNTYGLMFAGINEYVLGNDDAVANVRIPDVASVMPSQHMQSHLIHPTTLDILLHASLPLAASKLGSGAMMPVRVEEIAISTCID